MTVDNSLHEYLKRICTIPLLSAERERELFALLKADPKSYAREEITRSNLRFVVHLARQFHGRNLTLMDLIADGNLGLMRAVDHYDPALGVRFSTYAAWWIKQAIRRSLEHARHEVHISSHMVELVAKWRRRHRMLVLQLGREPGDAEMAAELGLSLRKVQMIRATVTADESVTELSATHNGQSYDVLPDEKAVPPHEEVSNTELLKMLRELLTVIDSREAQVLQHRYGLDSGEPLTLEEIGLKLNLTRERVRQIEVSALKKLNTHLTSSRAPVPSKRKLVAACHELDASV